MSTFDLELPLDWGKRLRDNAIAQAEANAAPDFNAEALEAVRTLALTRPSFTTDDVWQLVTATTHEGRAMGAVMLRAQRERWINPTDRTVLSTRPQCHKRPVRVWRSLLRRDNAA